MVNQSNNLNTRDPLCCWCSFHNSSYHLKQKNSALVYRVAVWRPLLLTMNNRYSLHQTV